MQAMQVVFPIFRAFAIGSVGGVTCTTGEIGSHWAIRAGDGAIRHAIAINVQVTAPILAKLVLKTLQRLNIQHLATIQWTFWIFELVRNPDIHAQIEIAQHKDRCLQAFCQIQSRASHLKAFFGVGREEDYVASVTMAEVEWEMKE